MPLCRYQIRNEFGLADREVYSGADKDDPEALLEAFAMAGLVGALRQLGDLAEFAAGIFSDLHDEVAATAARSHGVMIRVKHLEMELPLIEKTFLKQTNHSSFFYTAGIDWHPNMRTDENCITKGDLPRFITDSYEETRAPPSFIFLDRFDVAGNGACLKRYTNPSFYKVEAAANGTTNSDVHGKNESRKGKRRGKQWRYGRPPKALPTSHAKLHQLLLEENIEDNVSNPARHVKLKRRLNGFPFGLKTGKSYMEKILKDHSPDHELLERVSIGSVGSVPCDLVAEVEKQFNGSESPDMQLTNRNSSQKPELKNVVSYHIHGANNLLSNLHEDVGEKKIIVDRESNAKATMVSCQSDDVTSEVEMYIDTLASEPQIYSDPKLVTKTDFHVLSNRKQVPDLDVTKSLTQAHFPDSQSVGSSTLSDDGISSLKKCISTSSYSDGLSETARSIHLEAEVSNAYPINEIIEAKIPYRQLKWRECDECNDMADNLTLSSDNTGQTVSNVISAQKDKDSNLHDHGVVKVQKRGMGAQDLPGTEPSNAPESEIKLEQNVPFKSNTSTTHSGRGAVYCGSIVGVNLSEADVKRDETELNQCEMETGVSEAGDGKLLLKSYLKQRENSNDLDQEEYHIISPLSFLENLKNQQSRFDLLTQEKATMTGVGTPNVPLGSISPVLNVLPEAVKISQEEVPPPPPLPPVQGRMGRNQPISLAHVNEARSDNKGPSLSQSMTNQNTGHANLGKDLPLVHEATSGNSVHDPLSSLVHAKENHGDKPLPSLGKIESITQKLPLPANLEVSQDDDHNGPNSIIILQGTTADVTTAGDAGQTPDLAAMEQQKGAQLRNPLIDSIAAHDKTKLKKVTEQAGSKVHISDGRDSLLEQIRAKAFNLKPTKVQRPNIQGPTTNLRVAAILEKAKTIRHAFSGSDEDNDDSWSD